MLTPNFNPELTIDLAGGYGGNVAIQPDGKILIFGTIRSTEAFPEDHFSKG